ncbi:hypothetical protein N7499_008033 [Penicillium canescens]|nr:hypothetical protein N7499_008033 [Penicillium canescens]KAJ6158363.1 hypothetical protein N7485_011189 [Penicillium canescens]
MVYDFEEHKEEKSPFEDILTRDTMEMDGNIHWNGASGDTASEIAQNRANLMCDEIRKPARKIQTISDAEWDKWVEEARKRRVLREKAEQDEQVLKYLREKRIKFQMKRAEMYENQLARDAERDNRHRQWYEAFFNQFHDMDDLDEFPAGTWKAGTPEVGLLHRLRKLQDRTMKDATDYFHGVVTRKDPKTGNQVF